MHVVLIDGYGFIFRAYYSLSKLSCPNGNEIGAIYGFTRMMMQLITEFHASHIAICYDSGRKTFRHELYEDYKANRVSPPSDLITQFPIMREVNHALGIPSIELPGYEADDIIATLATLASSNPESEVTVVSSDKDLLQLMSHNIKIYDPLKMRFISEEYVLGKFGIKPHMINDAFALIGDSSDNVPGVPSIGPKTAATLIHEFGTIENLYDNIEQVTNIRTREKLKEHKESALLSKNLIKLEKAAPIPFTLDDITVKELDTNIMLDFLHKYGFKSLIKKIEKHKNHLNHNLLFAESLKINF